MDRYLENHYKGKYRIKAYIDQSTGDFCRDHLGNYEESFADFYIDCASNTEIKHGVGNILSCYIPALQRGNNVLRTIYNDKIEPISKENPIPIDAIKQKLIDNQILQSVEDLDDEVYFTFKADLIDYIAKLVKAKTSGASIGAFSVKNLPKTPYKIPEKDLEIYNELISKLPKIKMTSKDGKEREMVSGYIINKLISGFDNIIQKTKGKDFDIKTDRIKVGIRGKEYIHSLGMWNKFIDYLREEIKNYE